jgi:predicted dithiol-disulfide oxidoreductase (DUF899 family)
MGSTFPESHQNKAARERLLEQRSSCAAPWRPWPAGRRELPLGASSPRTTSFEGQERRTPTDMKLWELLAPANDAPLIYSCMFPRAPATSLGAAERSDRPRAELLGSALLAAALLERLLRLLLLLLLRLVGTLTH